MSIATFISGCFRPVRLPSGAGTFYFSGTKPYDWTAPQNDDRWQDEIKTLFDPCPAGWRVPRGGEEDLSPWQSLGTTDLHYVQGSWSDELGGAVWALSAGNLWYSGSGCRYTISGGMLTRASIESDCWMTTLSGNNYYFNFSAQPTYFYFAGTYHPAAGFSVRCIRE